VPFNQEQFQTYCYGAADYWAQEHGLNPPPGGTDPDANAVRVFSSYNASPGQANLSVQQVSENWLYNPPQYFLWSGTLKEKVAWHDTWNDGGAGPTSGNGVAITPRHVPVSEHGTEVVGSQLQWAWGWGNEIVTRQVIDAVQYVGGNPAAAAGYGWALGFRLCFLNQDLPYWHQVVKLINPSDIQFLPGQSWFVGCPAVMFNNWNEVTAWQIGHENDLEAYQTNDGQWYWGYRMWLEKPNSPNYPNMPKLWRQLGTDNPNLPGIDSGSGSPVFAFFTNSYNQSDIVYFGHVTNLSGSGPSYFNCHAAILAAVNQLNAAHPGTGNYQPAYVTTTQWVR
jgi:hypothetical protein